MVAVLGLAAGGSPKAGTPVFGTASRIVDGDGLCLTIAGKQYEVRKAQRGLWSGPSATAPWEWRSQRKQKAVAAESKAAVDGRQGVAAGGSIQGEATRPATSGMVRPAADPWSRPVQAAPGGDYWITNSSGIRHNSSCRYYQNSQGRSCGKDEGRACKICGG